MVHRLSYAHGASPKPLLSDTIGQHFDHTVDRFGEAEALVVRHQDIRWSWRQLKARVDDFAAGLLDLGLVPGERIGIWSPNNAEWVVVQFATAKAGLILVNINPAYRVTELEYALNGTDKLSRLGPNDAADIRGLKQRLSQLSTPRLPEYAGCGG